MKLLLLLVAPGIGLGLVLGVEPPALLRYVGAVVSFGLARDIAICETCRLEPIVN